MNYTYRLRALLALAVSLGIIEPTMITPEGIDAKAVEAEVRKRGYVWESKNQHWRLSKRYKEEKPNEAEAQPVEAAGFSRSYQYVHVQAWGKREDVDRIEQMLQDAAILNDALVERVKSNGSKWYTTKNIVKITFRVRFPESMIYHKPESMEPGEWKRKPKSLNGRQVDSHGSEITETSGQAHNGRSNGLKR